MLKASQQKCPQCNSTKFFKDGLRYSRNNGSTQRFLCRECGYRFSEKSLISSSSESVLQRQICVSAQRSRAKNLSHETPQIEELKAGTQQEVKGKLLEYSWWLKKEGYAEPTILTKTTMLKILTKKGANLYDPESIKTVIAQQNWKNSSKAIAVTSYGTFAKMNNIPFDPPKYKEPLKLPFIPMESEIDQLIGGCSKRVATFLQTLKETWARSGEIFQLKWIDSDFKNNMITITPEKNGMPRMFKVSNKLISMLNALPRKSDRIFGNGKLKDMRVNFILQRKRIAAKLKNPRLDAIKFHTLRHWGATMEYHRTKDILHVKERLGHRNINSTLVYTHLISFESNEYHIKVAKTLDEDKELLEAGFEYVTERDGVKIYRKRK